MRDTAYEKWIWIELIGFDQTKSEFGVTSYLETLGFIPTSLSILFFTPDFLHTHQGMEHEWVLPPEMCSYAARPYGKLNNRQQWTNFQIKQLVIELQSHGIAVYCSFFNLFQFQLDGIRHSSKWCNEHPELFEMRSNGEPLRVINPLKRLMNGTFYEDLFVSDLMVVMVDYGFDGLHGADGYTSPRLSLSETDYSDDMVEQFLQFTTERLPESFTGQYDSEPLRMKERAEWIWNNKRMDWIKFHAERWGRLWDKVIGALHSAGKKAMYNTAWTRDPFEALYRFGIDYQRIAAAGIDGFIVESVGASLSAGAGETEYEPGSEFMAMLLMIKSFVPDSKLICLNAIQDTNEQWDAINHAPTVLERDIFSFSNVYVQDHEGVRRCSAGFMACLGDGIDSKGWKWLNERWDLGFNDSPLSMIGANLVWSDSVLYPSLEAYVETRDWPVHKFVDEFISGGAPLHGTVNIRELKRTTGAILVTNLHLFPDDELQDIFAYRSGGAVLIGRMTDRIVKAGALHGLQLGFETNRQFCATRRDDGEWGLNFLMDENPVMLTPVDVGNINDSISWIDRLYFNPIPDGFLSACIETIIDIVQTPRILQNKDFIRFVVLEMAPGRWRFLIRNLHMNYKTAKIDIGRTIESINVLTDFPGIPVFPKDSQFELYVPGRGMVVIEVIIK